MKKQSELIVWLGLVGLAIVFRFITFFPLTIDMDESTYLVMADHILNGDVLYKDVIDIKPPGIFFIFAFIQFLFGKSVFMVRLFAAIIVGTGAFFIYRTKRNWDASRWASIISGAVYVFMFNFYFGFSANTEVFFVFFTTLGIWAFSKAEERKYYHLLAGIFLGLGFLVKLHVAFDALALGLFVLFGGILAKGIKPAVVNSALLTIGFLIPFALTHLAFALAGHYEYYHFITYQAPFNYSAERDVPILLRYFKDGMVTYLPFILMGITGFFAMRTGEGRSVRWLFVLLFGLEWLAILSTGKPHPHYWLQLTLPVALLAGSMAEVPRVTAFARKKAVRIIGAIVAASYLAFLFPYYHKRYIQRPLYATAIYEYLRPLVKENDTIYTGDGPQILYWLLNKRSPTPHIHQNHLTYPDKIATYGVNIPEEMEGIFSAYPRFVILSQYYPHDFVLQRMEREYDKVNTIDKFDIYQKKQPK